MIALTIGLIIATLMTVMFVANGKYRNDLDRSSRMIENGSFAVDRLTNDLRLASLYAEVDVAKALNVAGSVGWPMPTAMPDPCAVTLSALAAALPLGVQGYDAPSATTAPDLSATTCATYFPLSELKPGSDVLVVRHTESCVAGPTAGSGCTPAVSNSGIPYFQASHCTPGATSELNGNPSGLTGANGMCYSTDHSWCALDTNTANFALHNIDCTIAATPKIADYHRYLVDIYFVAKNDCRSVDSAPCSGVDDGIPTLKMAQLGSDSLNATVFKVTPIAEGIEALQIEYGLDTDAPVAAAACPINMPAWHPRCDGIADVYTADPTSFVNAGGCPGTPSACVQNWADVVTAKVHLLARNTEATPSGYTNDKSYTLGRKADDSANTYVPFNDGFKRHVYDATVRLYNQGGRREPVL